MTQSPISPSLPSSPVGPPRPPTPPRPSLAKRYSTTSVNSSPSSSSEITGVSDDRLFPPPTLSRGNTTRGTTPRTEPSSAKAPINDSDEGDSAVGSEGDRRHRRRSNREPDGNWILAKRSAAFNEVGGNGMDMTPSSSSGTTFGGGGMGTGVMSTPVTAGATRMASAAKERAKGKGKPGRYDEKEEDNPLSEIALTSRGYHSFLCFGHPFHLESRWSLLRELGQGAYGLVISAQDSLSGETIAIKMITRIFDKVILARRCLREITLLRHLNGHENITGLIDLDTVTDDFNEVYMFMEPMEADLHQIIRSGQQLTNSHIQYFLYQLLRGMKYIHSANVIHRDLKPGNILVNADCELKICDLGLARGFAPDPTEWDPNSMGPGGPLTEYVATRWYRAPEVMLSYKRYSTAIDVWSIGCILAELISGKPLLKGKDYIDQLNLILQLVGTPSDETLKRVGSEKACAYIRSLPFNEKKPFGQLFTDADPDAIDLLEKLLTFDPAHRITVAEALCHPYVEPYHDETDEPDCPAIFDKWESVEGLQTLQEFREAIKREVGEFRNEVRAVDDWEHITTDDQADTSSEAGARSDMSHTHEVIIPSPAESVRPSPMTKAIPLPTSASSESGSISTSLPSRRTSSVSYHSSDPFTRRPTSALLGSTPIMGMTPLPSANQPDNHAQTMPRGHGSRPSFSGSEYSHRGPKSRQGSSTGEGGFRPLFRALSSLSVKDLGGTKGHQTNDPPPMSVSPSDAPPSSVPLEFRPGTSRTSQETQVSIL